MTTYHEFDIGDYLLDHTKDRDIPKWMISNYKEGKAFSHFHSNWLRDVGHHNISDSSRSCFLWSSSVPSQNISVAPTTQGVNSGSEDDSVCIEYLLHISNRNYTVKG